jgi:hypothetical protein
VEIHIETYGKYIGGSTVNLGYNASKTIVSSQFTCLQEEAADCKQLFAVPRDHVEYLFTNLSGDPIYLIVQVDDTGSCEALSPNFFGKRHTWY